MSNNPIFENRLFTVPSQPKISFQEIQKGDAIRAEWTFQDIQITRVGRAHMLRSGDWYTEQNTKLSLEDRDAVYYLLDRPKPKLPTVLGAVIFSQMSRVGGPPIAFMLGASGWHRLPTGEVWDAQYIKNWKLAKVVEA
jgi:hypothetical protein